MIKQLKTLVLAIGLVAGMGLASTSFAAKPKEAAPAPAAAAPHLKQQHLLRLLPLWQRLPHLPQRLPRLLRTKRILMAWALCGLRATWWPRAPC